MKRGALAALALLASCAAHDGGLTQREQVTVLLQRSDGKAALPLIEALRKADPADLSLARAEAEAHVKAGSSQLLLDRLAHDDSAIAHYQKGLVLFARSADASGPAVEEFSKACALAPKEGEFQHRLGLALLESERYDAALPALTKALELKPGEASWQLPLAKARFRTGDSKGAVVALRAVVDAQPTPAEVKTARALMEQISDPFLGFPQQAKPQLEQGMQWLQVADQPQQAIITFEELLRDYPDLAVVHSLLGLAYQRLDDAGRAVDEFKRALELNPEDGKNDLYLANIYLARQRPQQAKEHLEQALAKNPLLDEAWRAKGNLELEAHELDQARKSFGTLASLEPDEADAHTKLAAVQQLEGDFPAADKELKHVHDKEPDNMAVVLQLGLLHTDWYLKAKAPQERKAAEGEARKWLDQVLSAQPDNAIASAALEQLQGKPQ